MPSWSSLRPSSRPEQSIPFDHSPRSLRAGDGATVGHRGTHRGQRHEVAGRHVEGAATDLQRLAVTGVDVHELDAIGVGMAAGRQHPGHHDTVEVGPQARHVLHGQAEVGQRVGDLGDLAADRGELAQPGQQHLHERARAFRTGSGTGGRR